MNDDVWLMLLFISYKIACLLIGALFAYMGYRLFLADKVEPAGDLDVSANKKRLLLKKAAPGTFFALFGTVVIAFTILKGVEYQTSVPSAPSRQQVENVLPDKPPF